MDLKKIAAAMTPHKFLCGAIIVAATWLAAIYPVLLIFAPSQLPSRLAPMTFPDLPVDAPQWYLGASTALFGDWRNLYPELNPEVFNKPNAFRPLLETVLFDAESCAKNPAFYPMFAIRTPLFLSHFFGTEWLSRYPAEFWAAQHARMRNSCFNYIFPPPTALVMTPLALFSLENMALRLWPVMQALAMLALALVSARIFRHLSGKVSYAEGAIVLASCLYPFADEFNCGNVSPFLAFFIAWGACAWIKGRDYQAGFAMIPALITKGLTLFWLPLPALDRRFRWRTLVLLAAAAVLLNGAVFAVAGWADAVFIYRHFFFKMLPHFSTVAGYDYLTGIAEAYGFYPAAWYGFFKILLLCVIYFGYWRRMRKAADPADKSLSTLAALGGTMCVWLFFSRLHWHHYFPFLFFLPFLSWLLAEIKLSAGLRRNVALAAVAMGCIAVFTTALPWFWASTGLDKLTDILRSPLSALYPDIVIWKFFLPGIRTLAILAGLGVALLRLYPDTPQFLRIGSGSLWRRLKYPLYIAAAVYFLAGAAIWFYAGELLPRGPSYENPAAVEAAARLGNRDAMLKTARFKLDGEPEAAFFWLMRGALLGDGDACFELARCYEYGRGTKLDAGSAYRWYVQAAFAGKMEAWGELSRLFPELAGIHAGK